LQAAARRPRSSRVALDRIDTSTPHSDLGGNREVPHLANGGTLPLVCVGNTNGVSRQRD
jgi:hypothetical protein